MIAAVGHADLTAATAELLETELRRRLDQVAEGAAGLVRAGAGLPVVFGRALRSAGRKLVVLLPAQGMVPAPLPERDRKAAGELLVLAEQVRLLPYDPADRDACVSADERLVASCRRLLAVWDGSASDGRDATAHLVAFAQTRGIPVDIVWPEGAARATDRRTSLPRTTVNGRAFRCGPGGGRAAGRLGRAVAATAAEEADD